MSIYINQLIQQLNLPNTFYSTAILNSYPLTAKLETLSATWTAIRYLNRYPLLEPLISPNRAYMYYFAAPVN